MPGSIAKRSVIGLKRRVGPPKCHQGHAKAVQDVWIFGASARARLSNRPPPRNGPHRNAPSPPGSAQPDVPRLQPPPAARVGQRFRDMGRAALRRPFPATAGAARRARGRTCRSWDRSSLGLTPRQPLPKAATNMAQSPAFFATEVEFRHWLMANHDTAPELLVGFGRRGVASRRSTGRRRATRRSASGGSTASANRSATRLTPFASRRVGKAASGARSMSSDLTRFRTRD